MNTLETLFADVIATAKVDAPPRHPCSLCGREMKAHHPEAVLDEHGTVVAQRARRICSGKACRAIVVVD